MARTPSDAYIRTTCSKCGSTFRTATKAANHVAKKHPAKGFVPPKAPSLLKVQWNKNGTIKGEAK